jgi:hypothetical protein
MEASPQPSETVVSPHDGASGEKTACLVTKAKVECQAYSTRKVRSGTPSPKCMARSNDSAGSGSEGVSDPGGLIDILRHAILTLQHKATIQGITCSEC